MNVLKFICEGRIDMEDVPVATRETGDMYERHIDLAFLRVDLKMGNLERWIFPALLSRLML